MGNMDTQETINYQRIEEAISWMLHDFKSQPSLETIAQKVGWSPAHFQRVFTQWAGTSPKQFLQYINLQFTQQLLHQHSQSLAETSWEAGLSSSSRLHDLYIKMIGMSPHQYRNGGANLTIYVYVCESPFGYICIGTTDVGVCHVSFTTRLEVENPIASHFPHAHFVFQLHPHHEEVLAFIQSNESNEISIPLHVKGSPFQIQVWEALLKIPFGSVCSYGQLADRIGNPQASRAVGTAIGSNPIAYLIPCHRVIQKSGVIGGYRWGSMRKAALLGWEQGHL
jgi:AraC family transcriptional regulator of adaptative response/methylated-DNA-[protein]-cysteine methyltransferase